MDTDYEYLVCPKCKGRIPASLVEELPCDVVCPSCDQRYRLLTEICTPDVINPEHS